MVAKRGDKEILGEGLIADISFDPPDKYRKTCSVQPSEVGIEPVGGRTCKVTILLRNWHRNFEIGTDGKYPEVEILRTGSWAWEKK